MAKIAMICHGQQLLITAKSLEGRYTIGYKSIKVDLEYAGAKFMMRKYSFVRNSL